MPIFVEGIHVANFSSGNRTVRRLAFLRTSALSAETNPTQNFPTFSGSSVRITTLFRCYGDRYAHTPNLDKLAVDGMLYTNAFSNAPVCAPSRSTLITGVYASSLGTQNMRSTYRIPDGIRLYPQYLKDAGYYCVNPGKKTDFNFAPWPKETYDDNGDWTGANRGNHSFASSTH